MTAVPFGTLIINQGYIFGIVYTFLINCYFLQYFSQRYHICIINMCVAINLVIEMKR